MIPSDDAAITEDIGEWRRGLWAAVAAIDVARRTGDLEPLDLLASVLGIGDDPADRGAWAAVCDALIGSAARR